VQPLLPVMQIRRRCSLCADRRALPIALRMLDGVPGVPMPLRDQLWEQVAQHRPGFGRARSLVIYLCAKVMLA
jgi:predicted DCC family thiol-disulfide oxidoreductase YuxK